MFIFIATIKRYLGSFLDYLHAQEIKNAQRIPPL